MCDTLCSLNEDIILAEGIFCMEHVDLLMCSINGEKSNLYPFKANNFPIVLITKLESTRWIGSY